MRHPGEGCCRLSSGGEEDVLKRLAIALTLGVLVALVVAGGAIAIHARPKSASPLSFRLVPAFQPCSSPNGTHGAPFSISACSPPVELSPYLTWNAPDRPEPFNTAVNGTGNVTYKMTCLVGDNPPVETGQTPPCTAPGDQEDMMVTISIADVRCKGVAGQGNCTAGAASLYNGKIRTVSTIEITDHYNNVPGQSCDANATCAGTLQQSLELPIAAQCNAGACNVIGTWDTPLSYGQLINESRRGIYRLHRFEVYDGGLNGELWGAGEPCPPTCYSDDGEGLYLVPGVFGP